MDRTTPVEKTLPAAEIATAPVAGADPENLRDAETIVGWLSLYVPTWGSSFVLHIAVVILAVFWGWQQTAVQAPEFNYVSVLTHNTKPNVEKRTQQPDGRPVSNAVDKKHPRQDAQGQSRGRNSPDGTSFMTVDFKNLVADFGTAGLRERLGVIGIGSGGDRVGGVEGLGNGSGRGIFRIVGDGADEPGRKIVYIVDRSGSMSDSLDFVKFELKRSLDSLDEGTEFHVIFYSTGAPVEMPSRRLVPATDFNRNMAKEFIDPVIAEGGTDPSKAIERAFAVGADLIYLLTDGEFDRGIVDLVKRHNPTNRTTVHTIGFLYADTSGILKTIAAQNGGKYKFVSEMDAAGVEE